MDQQATTVIPQHTYSSAPATEVKMLGNGLKITSAQAMREIEALGEGWRLEYPHELFALRSPLTHKNQNGAHSYDETIKPDYYWVNEEVPWFSGGRVVVGFYYGLVYYANGDLRAFARAVRVPGQ